MKIELKILSKGINHSGTLYHKSHDKPIKRNLARHAFLHIVNHHVIENDDIYTLKDRALAYNDNESTVCGLLEKNFSSCLPISKRRLYEN